MSGTSRFYDGPHSAGVNMKSLRQVQRRLSVRLGNLIDWTDFSLDRIVAAVAARVGGEIRLRAFPWEKSGLTGLTIGTVGPRGTVFLVLYEERASGEHQLIIILHELVHILMGHCPIVPPHELRRKLVELGLIASDSGGQPLIYSRPSGAVLEYFTAHLADVAPNEDQELEAELGATLWVTRARGAGGLPPAGQAFTPAQIAISTFLRDLEVA